MTAPAKKKKALIVTSFTDAGSGESFTANDTPLIEAGAFENYKAAGLVTAAPAERKATEPAKRRKSTRRTPPAAPTLPPAPPAPPEIAPSE
jgi:hypothetical protein